MIKAGRRARALRPLRPLRENGGGPLRSPAQQQRSPASLAAQAGPGRAREMRPGSGVRPGAGCAGVTASLTCCCC